MGALALTYIKRITKVFTLEYVKRKITLPALLAHEVFQHQQAQY